MKVLCGFFLTLVAVSAFVSVSASQAQAKPSNKAAASSSDDSVEPSYAVSGGTSNCKFTRKLGNFSRDGLSMEDMNFVAQQPGGAKYLETAEPKYAALSQYNKDGKIRVPLQGDNEKECAAMRSIGEILNDNIRTKKTRVNESDEIRESLTEHKFTVPPDWGAPTANPTSAADSGNRAPASAVSR